MTDESSGVGKIRPAPNGKFYVRKQGETVCLPDGSLRYFPTEHEARAFLAESDAGAVDKFSA
jgi:hypothetical protein